MNQKITCIGKRHHPHKMHHSNLLAQQTFKQCGLEQLLCDEHHRGCAEQATAWGYSPKYKHASYVIQCAAKSVITAPYGTFTGKGRFIVVFRVRT